MDNKKWLDLIELPKKENKIIWENCIGYGIPFRYYEITCKIEILDYYRISYKRLEKLKIKYKDEIKEIFVSDILTSKFKNILPNQEYKHARFKKRAGDIVRTDKKDLLILEQVYDKRKKKAYKYKCNRCGHEGIMLEDGLLKNAGCHVCGSHSKIITPEKNSIVAKPETQWMIQYFQGGYDEAKLYSPNSGKYIDFICPDCGNIKNQTIHNLFHQNRLGCNCSDGISYPNKFIYSIFSQLNIDFQTEKRYEWLKNKRFDIYIENLFLIIEIHGGYHYINTNRTSIEEIQANDKYKKELALQNGVKHYIELDCRKSNLNWIKDSVMNSDLPSLLHFKEEDIDWLECERYATKNIIKEICDYKRENPNIKVRELCILFSLSVGTIQRYLKKGNSLGWCKYGWNKIQ